MLGSVRTATGQWGIVLTGIGLAEAIVVGAADDRAAVVGAVGVVAADAMVAAGRAVVTVVVAAGDTRASATDLHGLTAKIYWGRLKSRSLFLARNFQQGRRIF